MKGGKTKFIIWLTEEVQSCKTLRRFITSTVRADHANKHSVRHGPESRSLYYLGKEVLKKDTEKEDAFQRRRDLAASATKLSKMFK